MRKLFAAAFLFLCASAAHGQGSAYTAGPFNTGGLLYVCTTPVTTTPCTSFASIFSTAALTGALTNPLPVTQGQAVTFYLASGQYAVQMPAAGFSQIVTLGGSSSPATASAPGQFNVKNFGAIGDAHYSRNCSTTSLSGTVTSTDNPWVAGDVGKVFSDVLNGLDAFNSTSGQPQAHITTFNSAGSIVVSPVTLSSRTGTGQCAWYTQSDTAAFAAAYAAAHAANMFYPGYNSPTLAYPATVVVPPGGYAVNGPILTEHEASNNTMGVSLIGGSPAGAVIIVTPDFVPVSSGTCPGGLVCWVLANNFTVRDLSFEGMLYLNLNLAAGQDLMTINSGSQFSAINLHFNDFGQGVQNGTGTIFDVSTSSIFYTQGIYVQNGPASDGYVACKYTTDAGFDAIRNFCSNHYINLVVNASANRTASGLGGAFRGYTGDECGTNGLACAQVTGSMVNFVGGDFFNPGNGVASLSIDGTSRVYLVDGNVSSYSSDPGNSCGITISSGGSLIMADSDVAGNNTSAAICGPAGASYVSVGGNILYNQAAGVRTAVTPATQTSSTFGWSGGINPKSTETHSPNTCYAATGTLVATQNLCTDLLDQNYQVLTIAATEGGNAPAATSCTVAPVITISDGTRSSTLTLTTAKTSWVSNVDASSLNAILASGSTMTISVGTFTCATPPVNLSVSYNLQSVLNQ